MPRAEHDALLARIKAHKQRLEDYRARLQAAERLLAELVKSEARLTELD